MRPFIGKSLGVLGLITALQAMLLSSPLDHAQTEDAPSPLKLGVTLELRTDAKGVDFNPFLQSIYRAVVKEWRSLVPVSFARDKGIVVIQFRIQQDQKVPDETLRVISNSGKKELEYAPIDALRNMRNSFEHLPAKFSKPFVEVRMTFYYNTAPGPGRLQNSPQSGL